MRKQLMPAKQIATSQSLASAFNTQENGLTKPIAIATADNIGIWIDTDSVTDNTGTFVVEIRPRYLVNKVCGEWTELTLDTPVQLADANLKRFINLNQVPHSELRVRFTPDGGTPNGTCNIYISGTGA